MKAHPLQLPEARQYEYHRMEKSVVIICNGSFPRSAYPRYLIKEADYIICCDGAFRRFLSAGKAIFGREHLPDIVIGDMDSLSLSLRKRYSHIMVHETDQEINDQTKAFNYAISHFKDISRIYITGADGKRPDHTIGNLSLLMEYARTHDLQEMGISVEMVSDYGTSFAITGTTELQCGEGRRISIFTPDNSLKIKSEGLVWPTDDVVFDNWWKATLNRTCSDTVKLTFSHPSVALIMLD